MAKLFTRLFTTRKTKQKQAYLKYYKAGGRLTYARWLRQGKPTVRTKAIKKKGLKPAGIDWERDKPSARLRRR